MFDSSGVLADRDVFSMYIMREQTMQEINEEAADKAETEYDRDHKKYLELKARFG